jgi:hypothetical protein
MRYVRIFADGDGASHFEDVEFATSTRDLATGVPPLTVAGPLPAAELMFLEQAGDSSEWQRHVTPSRRWIVVLVGQFERVVSDGERRRFGPGDVVLREDTTGEGSLTIPIGDRVRFMMIPTGD